ncbi:MAG TPA: hypothetical protein VKZ44_02210, partial [Taishania sp.]|nr:hypothetical protein [Taishania sp.]
SFSAPNFQINYRFLPKWEFVYLRSKTTNLLRRPIYTTVEAYYEPKILAVNYLSYQATEKLTISLFEGTIYSKGDSIVSKHASPWMYNPIPLIGAFVVNKLEANSIIGVNIGYTAGNFARLYGQAAVNPRSSGFGGQLGVRFMEPFKITNLFLQLEGNYTSNKLYRSSNPRLNYSHFNLPLAHTKGESFAEVVVRANYEIKRFYTDLRVVYYSLMDYSSTSHLALYDVGPRANNSIFFTNFELGYRFNKKMNFSVFMNYLVRRDASTSQLTNYLNVGLKTSLINSYIDF